MRLQRSSLATVASVASLALGGGVAWACTGPNGGPPSGTGTTTSTTTTTTSTPTTTSSTTSAATTNSKRKFTRTHHKSKAKRHAKKGLTARPGGRADGSSRSGLRAVLTR